MYLDAKQIDYQAEKLKRFTERGGDPEIFMESKGLTEDEREAIRERSQTIRTEPPAALQRLADRL